MEEKKITEEVVMEYPEYTPSQSELDVVSATFLKFRDTADARNRAFAFFDGLTLIEYIEDSVDRFTTNLYKRDDIEDWQARVHDPFTRNKVLAVLGKVVAILPIASFSGRGDEDIRKGQILTNLYEYYEEKDDYEELMMHLLLEAIVKGTAIGYEGVERKKSNRRFVKKIGDETTVDEGSIVETNLFGAIVPLEDFYPSSVSIRSIKKMPYCFWRSIITYADFTAAWGMFSKSEYVKPTYQDSGDKDEQRPFYMDYVSGDVDPGNVEIIRYYNKEADEYIVIANGVWINPLDGEKIAPLPFNHKELPFYEIKFDFFGNWFYGKSLPDRLKSLQDVLNVLTNMLLDQSFLTIFPPLLTAGFDNIEDDYLRPGRRTPIDTGGLPINSAFMKLDLGVPSGWHQYILEYTRKVMEQSSLDQVSSGQAGVGERTTAQEIRMAADGVTSMLGLFARMVNYGIKRKALFKAANILQFGTDPQNPVFEKVLGSGGNKEVKDAFNVFKIDSTVLSSGKRGTKIIEFYANKAKLPTREQLKARSDIGKADTGKDIEFVAISPEYIRDFIFDVKLVINPKTEMSKDFEKAMQLEKVRVYQTFFPDLIDRRELAAQTAEKMGDDPTKILSDQVLNPPQESTNESAKPMSQEPTQNVANNVARSARGGEGGAAELQALQGQMLG